MVSKCKPTGWTFVRLLSLMNGGNVSVQGCFQHKLFVTNLALKFGLLRPFFLARKCIQMSSRQWMSVKVSLQCIFLLTIRTIIWLFSFMNRWNMCLHLFLVFEFHRTNGTRVLGFYHIFWGENFIALRISIDIPIRIIIVRIYYGIVNFVIWKDR